MHFNCQCLVKCFIPHCKVFSKPIWLFNGPVCMCVFDCFSLVMDQSQGLDVFEGVKRYQMKHSWPDALTHIYVGTSQNTANECMNWLNKQATNANKKGFEAAFVLCWVNWFHFSIIGAEISPCWKDLKQDNYSVFDKPILCDWVSQWWSRHIYNSGVLCIREGSRNDIISHV